MIVRILSVLPTITGCICALLLLISLIGIPLPESQMEVPMIPCGGTGFEDCPVGMSDENLSFPTAFALLDLDLTIKWDMGENAWFGMVDSAAAITCPPNDNGLTECQPDDFEFIAGGPESADSFTADITPGEVRFVTGGKPGSLTMGSQVITISGEVGFNIFVELLLATAAIVLLMSAFEMAFPLLVRKTKKDE
jgi:hypothetical protein